jgi:hypothetical protein
MAAVVIDPRMPEQTRAGRSRAHPVVCPLADHPALHEADW